MSMHARSASTSAIPCSVWIILVTFSTLWMPRDVFSPIWNICLLYSNIFPKTQTPACNRRHFLSGNGLRGLLPSFCLNASCTSSAEERRTCEYWQGGVPRSRWPSVCQRFTALELHNTQQCCALPYGTRNAGRTGLIMMAHTWNSAV